MADILNQLPALTDIWDLIVSGFFLGALAGAIIGTLIWTLMERTSFSLVPMTATALIGLVLGIILEGDALRSLAAQDWQTFFSGPQALRTQVFSSIISIVGWSLGFMIIGAVISNYRLALGGFVLGVICGTLSGVIILVMGSELSYPVESPITIVLIVVFSIIQLVLISMSRDRR